MLVFLLVALALFLLRADYKVSGFHADYASPRAVMPVKGLFILLVFLSHFCTPGPYGYGVQLAGPLDTGYKVLQNVLGQMIVVPFLFFSGYGVVERMRAAGEDYLRTFVVKRLVKTVVLFGVAVSLYMALRALVFGATFPAKRMLLNYLGWTSAGNSNWYIFTVVLLYFGTYLSFCAFWSLGGRRREVCAVAGTTVVAALLVGGLSKCRPDYVYNTVFAYVAGCWFSLFRAQVEELLFRRFGTWLYAVAVAAAGFLMLNPFRAVTAASELLAAVFAVLVLLLMTRVRSKSWILSWAGKHLFSLYILQRLPMLMLKGTAVAQNRYVYAGVCLAATVALAVAFDFVTGWGWGLLERGVARLRRRTA